ncbi:MAG: hypothetical protein QHH27_03845 [Clostridia bacterium]|nr:hypothetical protein [Clostridia bacterium]MDH7572672.1 hypothetical protein [Clostridia bacterium]
MAKSGVSGRRALLIGGGAFFLAVLVAGGSQTLLERLTILPLTFVLLVAIILTGILFDIIGVAATAARETGFHAKAARRVAGARQALYLVRNAHHVASFCNDIVGDICATLSGAMGAAIVFRLVGPADTLAGWWAGILMTAVISGLTIGGKAWSKGLAIGRAEEITFEVGRLLYWLQQAVTAFRGQKGKRKCT